MTHQPNRDPLGDLSAAGVAVWLDDLSRELLAGGGLQSLVADRHVVGVTTNPTIFAAALSKGDRYDDQLADLAAAGIDVDDVTEHLEREGLAKFENSWSELGATVTAELDRQRHGRTGG
jgi:transaldolase